ncbi:MAG: hypothetical protein ABR512_01175 [Desulfopila sp.]
MASHENNTAVSWADQLRFIGKQKAHKEAAPELEASRLRHPEQLRIANEDGQLQCHFNS